MAEEKQFEEKIKKFMKESGAWGFKYWAGGGFTRAGIPDLIYCVNGYFVAVEVKAAHGKPSELQIHTINKIREAGGIAVILYPKHFETFKEGVLLLKADKPDKATQKFKEIGG